MTEVKFGNSMNTIGKLSFYGCSKLTEVILPDVFANLGNNAFSNCTALKKVYLGNSITNIGTAAFANCIGLSHVFLPKSLKITSSTSGNGPFYGCSGTLALYSDAPSVTTAWNNYFGRVTYNISYSEYLKITND